MLMIDQLPYCAKVAILTCCSKSAGNAGTCEGLIPIRITERYSSRYHIFRSLKSLRVCRHGKEEKVVNHLKCYLFS